MFLSRPDNKKFSIENLIVKYIKTDRNEPFIKLANNISYKKIKIVLDQY